MSPLADRYSLILAAIARWDLEGKRYPACRSEQEVCAALDRIGVEWEFVDGLDAHRIILASHKTDGSIDKSFCPDIYLSKFDVYLEICTSGLDWPAKRLKTSRSDCISANKHKTALARTRYGQRVILIYGSRYLRLTSRKKSAATNCLYDLIRKYGHPRSGRKRHILDANATAT